MRTTPFRPRLDLLEARVPPSDALFSLLFGSVGSDLTTESSLLEPNRPDHCGGSSSDQWRFKNVQTTYRDVSDLSGPNGPQPGPMSGEPVTGGALEAVLQSLTGGPSIQSVTVNFGVLPESSLRARGQNVRFGSDPPTESLDVDLDKETGLAVVPADRMNLKFEITLPSGLGRVNLRSIVYKDGAGTYGFDTGAMEISTEIYFHATSTLPGFDNENCYLGPLAITLSTNREGGLAFFGGYGTAVADDFTVPALAQGSCGSGIFGDWAQLGNDLLGLPIKNPGEAILTLNLLQDPAQPPGP